MVKCLSSFFFIMEYFLFVHLSFYFVPHVLMRFSIQDI